MANNSRGNLWSIMMAGGEGRRVGSFVERWLGRPLPKQFCAFVGKRSLLQHTVDRAARLTAAEQSVLVIAQAHRTEAMTQLDRRRVGTLLFQPADRGTGAGLFLPLTYVRARAPLATVIIYPSDHFVYPEERFLDSVREAVPVAEQLHDRIVLLGAAPDRLELDYGWILPGEQLAGTGMKPVLAIRKFIEKPTAQQADEALAHHALWNSMVIVSKVETLWRLGQQLVPELIERFERLGRAIGASEETRVLDAIYQSMPFRNFLSDFLQQMPERATMMELTNALWSDWGRPERITESLRRIGRTPAFPLEVLGSPFAPRLIADRIPTGA
ncbi:MAG: putative Mannose-phosphate guanylyltransferase [Nitrospira sp.]|nr:putative Mannose-phosphate guanylyltransferase [Nitrospira sp.]